MRKTPLFFMRKALLALMIILVLCIIPVQSTPDKTSISINAVILPATNVHAVFSATPLSGTAPLLVNFTDQSTGQITSRFWNFGDGGTSTSQNPSHLYQNPGSYSVNLTVTGSGGSNTTSKINYIIITPPHEKRPEARFDLNPDSGRAPLKVQFTDRSKNNPTKWYWDFGDGSQSTDQNPVHTYVRPNLYWVHLTVSNAAGNDSEWGWVIVLPQHWWGDWGSD